MQTQNFYQKMNDGTEISVNRWLPDEGQEIKGIVQLIHGMVEHAVRYDRLGSILAENGWVLSAHDLRGHGKTALRAEQKGTGMFGFLAEKDGFNRVVNDVDEIIMKVKNDFSGKKTVLLGHSFGSFIAQSYIENHAAHIDACVLCGTAGPQRALTTVGALCARFTALLHGKKAHSDFLWKTAFGGYTKRIPDAKNGQEWLSRDTSDVQMYLDDKWCGFNPTVGFYCDMTYGLKKIHKTSNMKKIPCGLPVFIIFGSDDPVGSYGKTIKKLIEIYKKNGMTDVTFKEYPGARHELFNEWNRDEVTADFLAWINSRNQKL
jgi:alpha-beta hydrolase superfamily lysophospholipase